MSIYDELPTGAYAKWDTEGDKVVGDIVDLAIGTDLQGNKCPQLTIRADDGDETIVTASQAALKAEIIRQRPGVGDRISITFVDVEKRDAGKTLKKFEVIVKTGGAKGTAARVVATADEF